MSVSNSIIETIQYPEASPISAKASAPDNWISRSPSTTDPFNTLINVCVTLILIAILGLLELHIRRSIHQPYPAVTSSAREALPGISWDMSAESNAVARKLQKARNRSNKKMVLANTVASAFCWAVSKRLIRSEIQTQAVASTGTKVSTIRSSNCFFSASLS